MTFDQIKQLIDILCEKGLHELEVERSDFRVRITAGGSSVVREVAAPVPEPAAVTAPKAAEPVAVVSEAAAGAHAVSSPIVGTFYRSPSPESDAYVQVGDRVKAGQVLCIVEAMKLMNEIESDVDGEVLEIVPANAQPVEFGEPLFLIRRDT